MMNREHRTSLHRSHQPNRIVMHVHDVPTVPDSTWRWTPLCGTIRRESSLDMQHVLGRGSTQRAVVLARNGNQPKLRLTSLSLRLTPPPTPPNPPNAQALNVTILLSFPCLPVLFAQSSQCLHSMQLLRHHHQHAGSSLQMHGPQHITVLLN